MVVAVAENILLGVAGAAAAVKSISLEAEEAAPM